MQSLRRTGSGWSPKSPPSRRSSPGSSPPKHGSPAAAAAAAAAAAGSPSSRGPGPDAVAVLTAPTASASSDSAAEAPAGAAAAAGVHGVHAVVLVMVTVVVDAQVLFILWWVVLVVVAVAVAVVVVVVGLPGVYISGKLAGLQFFPLAGTCGAVWLVVYKKVWVATCNHSLKSAFRILITKKEIIKMIYKVLIKMLHCCIAPF